MKTQVKLLAAALLAAASLSGMGCAGNRPTVQDRYDGYADPCWPERYESRARASVVETMGAQVANGHDVDQTLWNYHFEQGTSELNQAGRAKVDYLMRRRPAPDGQLNLQTARDIAYDPAKASEIAAKRAELDAKRINSVQQYVTTSTSGRNVSVNVTVKDPADLYMDATGPSNSVRGLNTQFSSTISGAASAGGTAGAGGGAAPIGSAASGGTGAPASGGSSAPR